MSNIAGKAYAMNLLTPMFKPLTWLNELAFRAVDTPLLSPSLRGLLTLSMIHYARWVIIKPKDWPRLDHTQPKEDTHYNYMLFMSNFNGSWAQYVDSFSNAIPSGLNLLWFMNVGWPKALPQEPFHKYVLHNQFWTNHYYSAYPLAASNDVKAGKRVRSELINFAKRVRGGSSSAFMDAYRRMLKNIQGDLGKMNVSPPLSVASEAASPASRSGEAFATLAAE